MALTYAEFIKAVGDFGLDPVTKSLFGSREEIGLGEIDKSLFFEITSTGDTVLEGAKATLDPSNERSQELFDIFNEQEKFLPQTFEELQQTAGSLQSDPDASAEETIALVRGGLQREESRGFEDQAILKATQTERALAAGIDLPGSEDLNDIMLEPGRLSRRRLVGGNRFAPGSGTI